MSSHVRKLHLQRCPKCKEPLKEISYVPVYRCAGCGAIVLAKSWKAGGESGTSKLKTGRKNLSENYLENNGLTSDIGLTLTHKESPPRSVDSDKDRESACSINSRLINIVCQKKISGYCSENDDLKLNNEDNCSNSGGLTLQDKSICLSKATLTDVRTHESFSTQNNISKTDSENVAFRLNDELKFMSERSGLSLTDLRGHESVSSPKNPSINGLKNEGLTFNTGSRSMFRETASTTDAEKLEGISYGKSTVVNGMEIDVLRASDKLISKKKEDAPRVEDVRTREVTSAPKNLSEMGSKNDGPISICREICTAEARKLESFSSSKIVLSDSKNSTGLTLSDQLIDKNKEVVLFSAYQRKVGRISSQINILDDFSQNDQLTQNDELMSASKEITPCLVAGKNENISRNDLESGVLMLDGESSSDSKEDIPCSMNGRKQEFISAQKNGSDDGITLNIENKEFAPLSKDARDFESIFFETIMFNVLKNILGNGSTNDWFNLKESSLPLSMQDASRLYAIKPERILSHKNILDSCSKNGCVSLGNGTVMSAEISPYSTKRQLEDISSQKNLTIEDGSESDVLALCYDLMSMNKKTTPNLADERNLQSISSQKNASENDLKSGEYKLEEEAIFVTKEVDPYSTGSKNPEKINVADGDLHPDITLVRSKSFEDFYKKVEAKSTYSSNEQVKNSLSLEPHASKTSELFDRIEKSIQSDDHMVVSEEVANRDLENAYGYDGDMMSQTNSSLDYDGSISSSDAGSENHAQNRLLSSRRTFRPRKFSEIVTIKETEIKEISIVSHSQAFQERFLNPKSSNERFGSAMIGSFERNQNDSCTTDDISRLGQEDPIEYEDSNLENRVEYERSAFFKSLSRDSIINQELRTNSRNNRSSGKFNAFNHDHVKLPRRVDILREPMVDSHDLIGEGNRISDIRIKRRVTQQPLFRHSDSELEFLLHRPIHRPHAASGPITFVGSKNLLSKLSLPAQTKRCCLQQQPEHRQASIQLPTSLQGKIKSYPPFFYQNNHKHAHEENTLYHKAKRPIMIHHRRPILGALHFITCYECQQLLQIPEDIHFARKKDNKLCCGACSKVLVFSLINGTHIVPQKLKTKNYSQNDMVDVINPW